MRAVKAVAIFVLLLLLSAFLDVALLPLTGGWHLVDPFLMMTVWYGSHARKVEAMLVGACCGVVQDSLGSTVFGTHFLTKLVVGYVAALVAGRLVSRQPIAQAALLAGGTVLSVLVLAFSGALLGQHLNLWSPGQLAACVVVNMVVGTALFQLAEVKGRRWRQPGHARGR